MRPRATPLAVETAAEKLLQLHEVEGVWPTKAILPSMPPRSDFGLRNATPGTMAGLEPGPMLGWPQAENRGPEPPDNQRKVQVDAMIPPCYDAAGRPRG